MDLADVESEDLSKGSGAVPNVDQLMQEKLQEETEKSTEGVAFLASEILDNQNILTVSHQTVEYLSLLSSSFALVISPLWQELAKQVVDQA
jgi:hypothetical protein